VAIRKRDDANGYQVDVGLAGGERVRRQAENLTAARKLEAELKASRTWLALDETLAAYTAHLRLRGKPRSVDFAEVMRSHLVRVLGPTFNAAALTTDDVDAFVKARTAEGVRPVSINGALRVLRAALRLRLGAAAPGVKMLRVGKRLPTALTLAQVDALAGRAASETVRLAIYLAAHAGLRHQEALHLAVPDCRFEAGELAVTAKPGWSPKSHHERVVPLSDRLAELLRARIAALGAGAFWLFPGADGGPRVGLHREIRDTFKAAGLWDPARKPGMHMLRRTFASNLLLSGVDVQTVRELGGWADIATVQCYVVSNLDAKRRAISGVFGQRS
jgi:integrase/recombinase XerD